MSSTKFQERLAERRAQREAEELAQKAELTAHDEDLLPQVEYERSEEDNELDAVLEGIDIIDAYRRWCGKMEPKVRGDQREGIMISCPVPGHIDSNPSAWINLDKQTWNCATCGGGDKYDIAAYRMGFSVPGYKEGAEFHKLREAMARDFGYTVSKTLGGATIVTPPLSEDGGEEESGSEEPNNVYSLIEDEEDELENILYPTLDWRKITPENTFIDEYMKCATIDDITEEYHFFNALIALGFTGGRELGLWAKRGTVYGNLFICTLGGSGSGKSFSRRYLDALINDSLLQYNSVTKKGVKPIIEPASGESVVDSFIDSEEDPSDPGRRYPVSVRGLVLFSELSSLAKRAERQGNTLKTTLQEMYDAPKHLATQSRTSGVKSAFEAFGSIITTSQPKLMRGLVSSEDVYSGFVNRWLFVTGMPKPSDPLGDEMVDMKPAVKPLEETLAWARTRPAGILQWTPEAKTRFTRFEREVVQSDIKAHGELLSRSTVTALKIILLLAINKKEEVVSVETVEDAIFIHSYLRDTYLLLQGQMGTSVGSEISEYVRRLTSKKNMSLAEIARKCRDNGKSWDRQVLLRVIETDVKLGLLEELAPETRGPGRRTVRYRYVG